MTSAVFFSPTVAESSAFNERCPASISQCAGADTGADTSLTAFFKLEGAASSSPLRLLRALAVAASRVDTLF
ncbi:hypothetical protein D3C85_857590 [compost metagenome]